MNGTDKKAFIILIKMILFFVELFLVFIEIVESDKHVGVIV